MKKNKLPEALRADLTQLYKARSKQELTRFTLPDWYIERDRLKAIRVKLGASQAQVASWTHINIKTLQLHEQKTGAQGVYATLFKILDKHPEIFEELRENSGVKTTKR